MAYIRDIVFDRLKEGKTREEIWCELGGHWNYLNRLKREWEREQTLSKMETVAPQDRSAR
jgi:hypothetical protein